MIQQLKLQLFLTLLLLMCTLNGRATHDINIHIDNGKFYEMPPHFWLNTGFCPPAPTNSSIRLAAFFNSDAVHSSMDMLSALPALGAARTTIRVHWLLNLIEARRAHLNPHIIEYNFGQLDTFVDHLVQRCDLVPVIEFMGNPSGVFSMPATHPNEWTRLVELILTRYIGK